MAESEDGIGWRRNNAERPIVRSVVKTFVTLTPWRTEVEYDKEDGGDNTGKRSRMM